MLWLVAVLGGMYLAVNVVRNLRQQRRIQRALAEAERLSQDEARRLSAQAPAVDESTTILEALLVQPRRPRHRPSRRPDHALDDG
jgi:hypothetical protein